MRPIVILGTPRSFTSLTAGIFRDHGVWFGHCKEYHVWCPTGSCENLEMKKILKANKRTAIVADGTLCPRIEGYTEKILKIMVDEGYLDGPLAFKHSAMFWNVWKDFDPYFICCRRPKESVMKSGKRSGMYATTSHSWDAHQKVMDGIVNSVDVHGEKYFEGDWSSLEKAFEFCGLEFDVNIANKLLDHKHKHF